jgi:hypothetical protein
MKRIMQKKLIRQALGKSAKRVSNSGFALMDLMIGAALTTVVVAAAGYGVTNMISSSTASNSRTAIRTDLSRSNDFIMAEIQKSSGLVTGSLSSPAGFTTASYSGKIKAGTTPTNVLAINPQGGSSPIVYFVATPAAGIARGPRALYRWGPAFNSDGTYSTTASWVSEVVVDRIQDATAAPSGWTAPSCSGTLSGDYGFSACVDSLGKSAKIYQNGKISKVLGGSESYGTSTNISSRKTIVETAPASFANGASSVSPFAVVGGEIVRTTSGKITATVLGSDWRACTSSSAVKTSVKATVTVPAGSTAVDSQAITIDPNAGSFPTITFPTVPLGSKVSFTGNTPSNPCGRVVNNGNGWNSVSNPKQVVILRNGDSVPANGGSGPNSASAADYVKKYVVNGKISLPNPDRQAIILFELGVTDPTQPGFDLQDIVILADMGA